MTNTAWSPTLYSAGNNFVFKGLSLPWKKKSFKNMCELLQHSPAFFVSFLKGQLGNKIWLCAVLACEDSNISNFKYEYLRENEYLRKNILVFLSGAQMGSIHGEKIEVENLVTLSLNTLMTPGGRRCSHNCCPTTTKCNLIRADLGDFSKTLFYFVTHVLLCKLC